MMVKSTEALNTEFSTDSALKGHRANKKLRVSYWQFINFQSPKRCVCWKKIMKAHP